MMLIEKFYSKNSENISVGIANINSKTENLSENKKKIVQALNLFSKKNTNIVIFPEYCLSGYFWEPEAKCRPFMEEACLDDLKDWLDEIVRSYVNETLQYIVFNGLRKNKDIPGMFFNTSIILDHTCNYFDKNKTYKKAFLPGLEKRYITSGINDTLVLETVWGKFGLLTCYEICFPLHIQKLAYIPKVDALIVNAAWRKQGVREYSSLKIKDDSYYKTQWDILLPALACHYQVWIMAANAVGPHSLAGLDYCGSSGIWAPSGINMINGSDTKEELLILHNIDIFGEIKAEKEEFCFIDDFRDICQKSKS